MRKLVVHYLLLLALALAAPALSAQELAPDALLRAVTFKVTDILGQDQEPRTADSMKVMALVENDIAPLFDFGRMTQLAMAHNWRLATPEQQMVLTQEFRSLLLRTYSSALANYRSEVFQYKRLRAPPLATEVTVRSEVEQVGKEKVALDYEMEKTPAGWKIYDVKVAGVRLVTTYRDIFAEQVRKGGVSGLIQFLANGNREGSARFNSVRRAFWEKSRLMYAIFQNMFRGGPQ